MVGYARALAVAGSDAPGTADAVPGASGNYAAQNTPLCLTKQLIAYSLPQFRKALKNKQKMQVQVEHPTVDYEKKYSWKAAQALSMIKAV